MEQPFRIAITHGDYNGVGYEVILKTFADNRMLELCTPVLYGSTKVAAHYKKMLQMGNEPTFNTLREAKDAVDKRFNVVNLTPDDVKVECGVSSADAGRLAAMALECASADLKDGIVDAVVTAPINKNNIHSDAFPFTGHTEYFANKYESRTLMMMVSGSLRIGIMTNHLAISQVQDAVTAELLREKIEIMEQSLRRDFGITKPRIAVLALDPHAGDNGTIGLTDTKVVVPAIGEAQQSGKLVFGPYPADGLFGSGQYRQFDGILALYHDQGMIPFKLLSMAEGVNYTAGLPVVRTSPAHGTAYDIAGKNQANEQSMRSAIYLACDILRNRKQHEELTRNPLK